MTTVTNNTTANYYIPLPYLSNRLVDDLNRITSAIVSIDTLLAAKLDSSSIGTINGIATLDSNGRISSTQLPNFTGDVTSTLGSATLTLTATGVDPGTYTSVTVDAKGRISAGSNPSTLAGFGITDALPANNATWAMCLDNGETYNDNVPNPLSGGGVLSINGKHGAVTLTKYDIGLENVDNTPDFLKPLSSAATIALAGKQGLLRSGINIKTINGQSILGSGNISISGGGGGIITDALVDWTSLTRLPTTLGGYGITDATPLVHTVDFNLHLTPTQKTFLTNIAATATELNYVSGVTSSIQTQLNSKQNSLVSGSNIRTINGTSIVGSGNVYISGGLQSTSIKTADYSAKINDLVRIDTTYRIVTIDLPSNASDGSIVGVVDVTGMFGDNYALVQAADNQFIEGDPDLILDVPGTYVTFTFIAATSNWKLLETPAAVQSNIPNTIINPYTGAITSVAGRVGDVVLTNTDVGLSNVDNIKQLANTQTLSLIGDVTATSTQLQTGVLNTTLANSGVTAGTYLSATTINALTIDSKGRVTHVGPAATIQVPFGAIINKPSSLSEYGISTAGTGSAVLQNAPTITNPFVSGTLAVGSASSANISRFPNATVMASNTSAAIQQNETLYIGMVGEAVSVADTWASGLYGAGYTNGDGTGRGTGVTGEGHVSSSTDTGACVGVRGYANDTHSGGLNVGLYGDATNGSSNYSLFLNNGNIYTSTALSWSLHGNLTFSGAYSVVIPTATVTTSTTTTATVTSLILPSISGIIKGNGASAASAATAGTDYVAPASATTFTATQTFGGSTSVVAAIMTNMVEVTTIVSTAITGTPTIVLYTATQSVMYYNVAAGSNWSLNITHSSGTTLNTAMSIGQSITVALAVTQGATPYYLTAVTVDGAAVTVKWQGGTAPIAGNASSIDVYTVTIIKTGASTFTALAAQTRFG